MIIRKPAQSTTSAIQRRRSSTDWPPVAVVAGVVLITVSLSFRVIQLRTVSDRLLRDDLTPDLFTTNGQVGVRHAGAHRENAVDVAAGGLSRGGGPAESTARVPLAARTRVGRGRAGTRRARRR